MAVPVLVPAESITVVPEVSSNFQWEMRPPAGADAGVGVGVGVDVDERVVTLMTGDCIEVFPAASYAATVYE